jgi:hypothetical protein
LVHAPAAAAAAAAWAAAAVRAAAGAGDVEPLMWRWLLYILVLGEGWHKQSTVPCLSIQCGGAVIKQWRPPSRYAGRQPGTLAVCHAPLKLEGRAQTICDCRKMRC